MRMCKICGLQKEEHDFTWMYDYKADGTKTKAIQNVCKKCTSKRQWQYTLAAKKTDPCRYYAKSTWTTLNQRACQGKYSNSPSIKNSPQMQSYHKKGIELHITKEELTKFWYDNESKVKAILSAGETPSIDRINDKGHYSLDNIQIISRKENIHKSRGYAENPKPYDPEQKKEENRKQYLKHKENKNEN